MISITITDHLTSWFNISNIRKYLEELKSLANPLKSQYSNYKINSDYLIKPYRIPFLDFLQTLRRRLHRLS